MRLATIFLLVISIALLMRWGMLYKYLYFPVSLVVITPLVLSYFKNKGLKSVTVTTLFIVSYVLAFLFAIWSFFACFLLCNVDYDLVAGSVFYLIFPFLLMIGRFNKDLILFSSSALLFVLLVLINFLKIL